MRDNSKANAALCRGRWPRILSVVNAAGYAGCTSAQQFRAEYGDLIFTLKNQERIDIYELDERLAAEKETARQAGRH